MANIKKGSFTVEAAFLLPVILTVLFGVLRGGLLLYEEALEGAAVLRDLERKEMAERHRGDVETGRPDYEEIFLEPEKAGEFPVFYPAEYKRRLSGGCK